MEQILQVSVDDEFLCQVSYNKDSQKFEIYWTEDESMNKYKVDFNHNEELKQWLLSIENNANCSFTTIRIQEIWNYGDEVFAIDEIDEFLTFKMDDLRNEYSEVCVYQLFLKT